MEHTLSHRKQLTGIIVLLTTTGLMWFGFFMLIPLLAVHITHDLGMGAAIAGMVLAVRQFTQFGLGLFTGALADWAGYRRMIMLGMLVRALGFIWIAWASDVLTLTLSAALAAVGGAFFESSSKAALASLSKGYKRETIFSLSATVGNLGMSTGPLLGVALIKFDFALVGVIAGLVYIVNFFLLWAFVPRIASTGNSQHAVQQMFSNLGKVWHNKPFVIITALMVGYYALYSQINITLPLEAARLTGTEDSVSLLYVINSGLAISLQFLSVRYLSHWFKSTTLIGLGTLVAGLGLFLISFVNSYLGLIACVVIYALGRLVVEPTVALVVSEHATDDTLASYFGFSALALGIGGVFGNFFGGWMFDYGREIGIPGLCWWVFGAIGVGVLLAVLVIQQVQRPARLSLEATASSPDHS